MAVGYIDQGGDQAAVQGALGEPMTGAGLAALAKMVLSHFGAGTGRAQVPAGRLGDGRLTGMDEHRLRAWAAAYERAWRTSGTDGLGGLFTADATYRQSPYMEPVRGLDAIAYLWEAERDGADEVFRMTCETVAVDGDTGVMRVEVFYGDPVRQEFRDLWILHFAEDGRCRDFEEWPFSPR